ncbi:hypothetical protein niasHT_002382 [Heterodera trifolii]|uniref:Uncharacterized protein n=1 Tax=Heterodera trifolii TaxID=157864 RepID=A0ABD2LMB4_9BILA
MHLMAKVSIPQQSVRDGNGHNGDTRLAAVKPLVYYSGLASPAHPLTSPPQAIPSFICISFSSFCSEAFSRQRHVVRMGVAVGLHSLNISLEYIRPDASVASDRQR